MLPYHLTHLALPTIHLKPQKETVLHSSFPLSPCRHSLPLLPESNLRHLECPHADRVPRGPTTRHTCSYKPLFAGHTAPSRTLAAANPRYPGDHTRMPTSTASPTQPLAARLLDRARPQLNMNLSTLTGTSKGLPPAVCLV